MSDKLLYVRDVLVTDFLLLSSEQSVTDAHDKLVQASATYGVVTNDSDQPIVLTTVNALANSKPEATLQTLSTAPLLVTDSQVLLAQAILSSSRMLFRHPEIVGLVVSEKGKVIGVLPVQTLGKHAEEVERHRSITELAGVPLTRARYFYCPEGPFHYKELVIRYDPDNPPRCPTHWWVALIKE